MYSKILLKISGETFAETGTGVSVERLENFVQELKQVLDLGVKVALVIGGGNFWRERDFRNLGLEASASDQVGMLATIMNGLVFADFLRQKNIPVELFSARSVHGVVNEYNILNAQEAYNAGKVSILAGGTGNPFFTTDSAAVLRALELDCDVVLKGTKVDGVFDSDPKKNPQAQKYDELTFEEAIAKKLKVLDQTAFSLALKKRIPLIVFDIFQKGALLKAVRGEKAGSLVR